MITFHPALAYLCPDQILALVSSTRPTLPEVPGTGQKAQALHAHDPIQHPPRDPHPLYLSVPTILSPAGT